MPESTDPSVPRQDPTDQPKPGAHRYTDFIRDYLLRHTENLASLSAGFLHGVAGSVMDQGPVLAQPGADKRDVDALRLTRGLSPLLRQSLDVGAIELPGARPTDRTYDPFPEADLGKMPIFQFHYPQTPQAERHMGHNTPPSTLADFARGIGNYNFKGSSDPEALGPRQLMTKGDIATTLFKGYMDGVISADAYVRMTTELALDQPAQADPLGDIIKKSWEPHTRSYGLYLTPRPPPRAGEQGPSSI